MRECYKKLVVRYSNTMPQPAIPSTTLAAAVRGHLGLSQEQLAAYLGVSRGQVAHVEAGRRQLRAEAARLLRELAAQLPPLLGSATGIHTANELPPPPPAAKLLARRRKKCHWQLNNLRMQLAREEARVARAHRWQALTTAAPALLPPGAEAAAVRRARLWREWATIATDALSPDAVARRLLVALRIQMLEAEERALEELLVGLPLPTRKDI